MHSCWVCARAEGRAPPSKAMRRPVIPQVWVGVLPVGPSGHTLCSSYQSRDDVK